MPEIYIPFVHGANEAVDPKLLPQGWLTTAENIRFRKDGRPGFRYGYTFLSGSQGRAVAAGDFDTARAVYFYDRSGGTAATCSFRRTDGTFSTATTCSSGGTFAAPIRLTSARNFTGTCVACDVAINNGYIFEVYFNRDRQSFNNGLFMLIYDQTSHTLVKSLAITGGASRAAPKVVSVGSKVLVFYGLGGSPATVQCVVVDATALTAAGAVTVSPTDGTAVPDIYSWDVHEYDSTRALFVWNFGNTGIAWGTVSTAGVLTSKGSVVDTNPGVPTICKTKSANVAFAWRTAAQLVKLRVVDINNSVVTATTTIDGGGQAVGTPVIGPGGTVEYSVAWQLLTQQMRIYDSTHGPGAGALLLDGLVPVSKPFAGPGASSLLWTVSQLYDAGTEGTYRLVDAAQTFPVCECVAAQFAAPSGGNYLGNGDAAITPSDWDPRRHTIALPATSSSPNAAAFATLLPVITGPGGHDAGGVALGPIAGADLFKIDYGTWVERLQPANINGQLFFSGPRVREYDGTVLHESGFASAPEHVSATISGSSGNLGTGTYQYVVTYTWVDSLGRRHRSAPSIPVSVAATAGQAVDVAAVPLPFTDKVSGAMSGTSTTPPTYPTLGTGLNVGVTYEVWGTQANGSIFYRVNMGQDVRMSLGSGAVAVITDKLSDSVKGQNETLYTQGERGGISGLLPNDEPPPCRFMWASNSRLILGGLEDPTAFQLSKRVFPGEPLQFTIDDGFRGRIPELVTGVAALDGTYYVGSAHGLWAVTGDGPDDNGGGGTFGDPIRLPSEVGFYSYRSILEVPQGLLFQGKADRIYLLPRGGNSPTWVAQNVRDTLLAYPNIIAATLLPAENTAVFACVDISGSDGVLLVYDTRNGEWTVDKLFNGRPNSTRSWQCLNKYNDRLVLDGRIQQTPGVFADNDDGAHALSITATTTSGDIRPFGMTGRGKSRKLQVLGEMRDPAGASSGITLTAEVSYDSGLTWPDSGQWALATASPTFASSFELDHMLLYPKGDSYRVRLSCSNADVVGISEGVIFNGLSLEVYPSQGLNRQAPSRRA